MSSEESRPCFPSLLIADALKEHLPNDGTLKLSPKSAKLFSDLMSIIVVEIATRAADQAKKETCDTVDLPHIEKILAQLLLDL